MFDSEIVCTSLLIDQETTVSKKKRETKNQQSREPFLAHHVSDIVM